jgi:hypothetical protein
VRRDWPVRITESLGAQQVSIPDLTGESERAATVSIRRLSLELGTVAYLGIAGDPDVVLTQTPPVNAAGVDGPRVSSAGERSRECRAAGLRDAFAGGSELFRGQCTGVRRWPSDDCGCKMPWRPYRLVPADGAAVAGATASTGSLGWEW